MRLLGVNLTSSAFALISIKIQALAYFHLITRPRPLTIVTHIRTSSSFLILLFIFCPHCLNPCTARPLFSHPPPSSTTSVPVRSTARLLRPPSTLLPTRCVPSHSTDNGVIRCDKELYSLFGRPFPLLRAQLNGHWALRAGSSQCK